MNVCVSRVFKSPSYIINNSSLQINGFDSALASAKKQAQIAVAGVEEVRTLLHQLDARTNETILNVTNNMKLDEDIKSSLLSLNTTVVSKLEALNTRIHELNVSL